MRFLPFTQKPSRPGKRSAQPPRARLFLETLEGRVTPTVTLSNGHLFVTGDDGGIWGDDIAVGVNSVGGVLVSLNSQDFAFKPGQVLSIDINPALGINTLRINATLPGVPVSVNTAEGADDDTIMLGDAAENLGLLQGGVTVNGNGGGAPSTDTVILEDNNHAASDTYTVTAGSATRPGFAGLTYHDIRRLSVIGGSGSDTYNVVNTAPNLYTIIGNSLSDTFNLGTGNLSALEGEVDVLGPFTGVGQDRVILHDEANSLNDGYDLEASTGEVPGVSISSGGFHAVVRDIPVTLNAGAGDNTFFVAALEKDLDFITNPLTLNGGGGHNALVVNDSAARAAEGYTVNASFFSRTDGPTIILSGMESVTVDGSNNGSSFQVPSITNGTSVILNTGTGQNDVLAGNSSHGLGDIQGYLAVFGTSPGFTSLTLDDGADGAAGTVYLVGGSEFHKGLLGRIDYVGVASLALDAGSGSNDEIAVLDTPATLSVTINAGAGGDFIHAGGSFLGNVDPIHGPLAVNGQGSNTTFTVFDQSASTPQTYTVTGTATATSVTRSGGFSATCTNLKSLTVNGGTGGNQFVVTAAPAVTPVTLNGGGGSNTLTGPNGGTRATTWTITGAGSGKIGKTVVFSAMHDLAGAAGKDLFVFPAGGSIAGTITGGGGGDELEYAPQAGPVTINLQTRAAPQIHGGAAGGFSGIPVFIGSASAADTLIGLNADTVWAISGGNGGSGTTSATRFSFSGFENLVGGSGVDVFKFAAPGRLTGSLDGGAAPLHKGNWLDYSGLTTAVTVNLQTGSATAVAGGAAGKVANIQNVHGGDGGNILTGNAQGNILIGGAGADTIIGGSGFSLLIGGKGADTVTGHSGNDILIGGSTAFDPMRTANEAALMAILTEWQSADSYADRFGDINQGSSYAPGSHLNGNFRLRTGVGATVLDDAGAPDTVTEAGAGPRRDWFFQYAGDTINNQPGEHVNNT
jgi:hypothetical protein